MTSIVDAIRGICPLHHMAGPFFIMGNRRTIAGGQTVGVVFSGLLWRCPNCS
jgi:hypothetical protein